MAKNTVIDPTKDQVPPSPPTAETAFPAPGKLQRNPVGGQSNDALSVNKYIGQGDGRSHPFGQPDGTRVARPSPFGGKKVT